MDGVWKSAYVNAIKHGFTDEHAYKLANSITRFKASEEWLHDARPSLQFLKEPPAKLQGPLVSCQGQQERRRLTKSS